MTIVTDLDKKRVIAAFIAPMVAYFRADAGLDQEKARLKSELYLPHLAPFSDAVLQETMSRLVAQLESKDGAAPSWPAISRVVKVAGEVSEELKRAAKAALRTGPAAGQCHGEAFWKLVEEIRGFAVRRFEGGDLYRAAQAQGWHGPLAWWFEPIAAYQAQVMARCQVRGVAPVRGPSAAPVREKFHIGELELHGQITATPSPEEVERFRATAAAHRDMARRPVGPASTLRPAGHVFDSAAAAPPRERPPAPPEADAPPDPVYDGPESPEDLLFS